MSDNLNAYEDADAEVLALSVDSPFSQKAWKEQEKFNVTLVSDFNREVVSAYGAQYGDSFPFHGVAKRSAFVIDKAGKIRYAEVMENAGDLPDFDKVSATLKGL